MDLLAPQAERASALAWPGPRANVAPGLTIHVGLGAGRIARQILSLWKDLEIHFSSDRGKSEGCRQKETRAQFPGLGPPSLRVARARRPAEICNSQGGWFGTEWL